MQNLKLLQNMIAACWVVIILLHLIDVSTARRTFYVYEGQAPGEFVGNLNTNISNVFPATNAFRFDYSTGVIKTNVVLDREVKPSYTFTVLQASSTSIQVHIEVKDINDEFPTFSSLNKTVSISEAYDVGHIYDLNLQVTDNDLGVNTIHNDSVRIVSGNVGNVFKINLKKQHSLYAVSLEITKKLNWSAVQKYNLNLSASDSGSPKKTSYMALTVIVQDHNNCHPQFSKQSYVVDVSESVKKGTIVLNITTSDCDGGKNAEVTYTMNYDSYDKGRYFSVRQENRIGYIVTSLDLDYETTKIHRLQIIATDHGNNPKQSSADVTVVVRDENDNSPEIVSFKFSPINEDAKVKSLVARIEIRDKDSGGNGKLNVSLDPMSVFSIFEISQDVYHVYLETTLDHEYRNTYHIIVTATDNGKPPRTSKKSETLVVGDVNDNPPKFDKIVYTGSILESEMLGTFVLKVTATDKDHALNITYHILSTNTSWFGINSTSGAIYVASSIDREQSDKAVLVIQAFDGKFTANCTVVLRIIDSNDNAPQFSNSHYIMTVLENLPSGTLVGRVDASDVDLTSKGHISYALGFNADINNVFTINNITGNITAIKELDRENTDVYNFSVFAYDEGDLHSEAIVTVKVGDVNDNRPLFRNNFYNYTFYENISIGTDLVKIEAEDYDIGWNAQLSFEIISGNDDGTFDLDKSNGQISLHKRLDREKVDKYVLILRAIDNGGLTSHKLATVQILVKDVNDDPPVFQKDKYSFSVNENNSLSVFVGTVLANSYDQGPGGIISYSIKTLDSQQHFYINDSGAIFTNAKLDHEVQSRFELLIEARDHGNPVLFGYVNVSVTVIDINDNSPVWKDDSRCIELNENRHVGDKVHVFNAYDKDSGLNGKVTYSIVSGPDSVFNLNSETGLLLLNMLVDYEQVQLYQLIVNASDSGKPALWSLLHVNICVIDYNDNSPVLHNSSVSVKEDLPVNALIYTFHAVDKDSGKNGKVWYKFVDDLVPPSHFELSSDGNLTLKSPLDRETQVEHEVYVLAGDLGSPFRSSSLAKLTIYVQDVNDEIPVFKKKLSFLTTENKLAFIGKVEATDRDLGKNSEIEYSLVNSTDNFKIDSDTGKLRNIVELDREKYPVYRVEVQASDKGNPPKSSRATVNVYVQDINDNPPIFTKSPYNAKIAENAEKGAKVVQVEALDRDEGLNGEVSYYHNTGNTQGGIEVFQINETTGCIYIVASLDREIKEFFVLSVVAKDKGSPPRESVCQVLVTVLDVNDHKPEFKVKNDTIYISEKTPIGSIVYWANATDQDKDENGNIVYSLVKVSGVFRINAKNGAVFLNKTLDYEHTKQYSLRIKASDKAKENPKKSILRLYINILDSNDNGPIFDENPISTYVVEGVARGTNVYKPILARDKDSGINSRIVYSIESQTPKAAFEIDPFKAQLSTDVEIDREDVSQYTLVVKAMDQAGEVSEQKSNTVTVIINVLDVNDCYPVFTSRNKSFIMEDEPVNFTVFYFTAEDKDLNQAGNVTFSVVEGNEHGIFYLDPLWGSLILLKPLDREKKNSYELKIEASDQGSPRSLSSTIIFTLSVEDVNDNMPRFLQYEYKAKVPENEDFAHVLKVKATDLDSGQLTYSLPPGFTNNPFVINESTGQITTNSPLNREKQQIYKLTVYVQDKGYPLYTDKTTVEINVTDKNDNVPIVLHDFYEVKVLENSPAGYVCTIIAQDFDTEINAQLQYSIEGDNFTYFKIDENAGTVSTVSPLDRESSPAYNLTIKIEDQGHPSLSVKVKLLVIVQDENDNNPKFRATERNVTLLGSSQPGTEVVTLIANDDDENSDTAITYSFASGQQIPFALDSKSGLIYTLNYLNASEVHRYVFTVNASDGSNSGVRFGSIKVNVFVDRITGIPFRFTNVLYEVDFKSQVKAGIEFLQLRLKNTYLQPEDVEYIREGGQKVLAVNQTSGNVSFTEDPRPGAYLFSVRATLVRDRSITAVCYVLVTVQYTIQRPSFSHSSYSATLNENDPSDTLILTVKPYTLGNVSYQIVNGNAFGAFKIGSNGEVTVKKADILDYERSRSFELDIKGDWGNTVTNIAFTKLYLSLRNLDDKAPAFRQKVFISHIPETESGAPSDNRFVTKLHAFNFGNSQMSFSIASGNKESVFFLDSLTGELYLRKAVDREDKNLYNLTVGVSASQLSSNCSVLVFITDVNDNSPQLPGTINITIFENSPLGSRVGQVNATDKDDYSILTYSFSNTAQRNGPFVIDLYTGILRLVGAVDFETAPNLYILDVVVSDQVHAANTTVFVTVLDENDNKPVFEKPSYGVKRTEPISVNTLLARINATDNDQGDNKRIAYNITLNDEIGIHPSSGTVFVKKEIIYTKDFIDLIITATDYGSPKLSSQVPFRLQISYVSNKPDLGTVPYDVTISEDIEVGTEVVTIKPINSESLIDKKRISFQILDGDELKMFRIEERTGTIRVRRQLDRESTELYTLNVIAKDSSRSHVSDRITVRITIGDVNDNAPVFQRNRYYVNDSMYEESITENVTPPRLVLIVQATDKDKGRNKDIKYSISSGNDDQWFSMKLNHEKGELWLVKPIDRDVIPIHRLSVRATDQGTPPRASDISVVIKVKDVNDNAPVFVKPRDLGVAENALNGTDAGTIKASDSDSGANKTISLSIVNGTGLGKFNIEKSTGNLTNAEVFDYEKKSSYTLVVKAQDHGTPPKYTFLTVTVPIISVDEFEPTFQNKSYEFVVSGDAKKGDIIGRVHATDLDSGPDGKIEYKLHSPVNLFAINSSSGDIYLTRDVADYYEHKRNKRDTESSNQLETFNVTIIASSGQPGSKISKVTAGMSLNYTVSSFSPNSSNSSISEAIQTVIIAVGIVAFLALLAFLIWFVRCKRKEGTETKKPSDGMVLGPMPSQRSFNSADEKGLINKYEHVPTSASNSLQSGSSGNGSSDVEDELIDRNNIQTKIQMDLNVTDSGIQPDCEGDISPDSDVENSDARSFDVRSDRTDRMIAHLQSIESLHDFDDEGGREASAGIHVGNLLYAKCAEADAEGDDQDRPRVFNFEGRPDYTGSLSSILGSHEELRGHYNYSYVMNQGPQYQPLSEVFSEIGRLPSKELDSPMNGINDYSARTSMLSSVSSLHTQHLDPESTYSSLPMTPNFTPAITPLVTRSPSLSPLTSEVVTPMVSPSQSRPSSMYLPRSRPSSSIQLAERHILDDFDEDVNV